ncbi:MAG: ABC transporter ATP-binding protein [Wenzhouxiangella sp.]
MAISTESTYRSILSQFFAQLSRRRRFQLVGLLGLMFVGALAELVTIGAVVPFIGLLARPGMAAEMPVLQQLFSAVGWQNPEDLVLPMTLAFVATVVLATSLRMLLTYTGNKVIYGIGYDLSVKLYGTILDQPYAFHIAQNTSEVIAGVNKAQMLLGALLRPVMQGMISLLVGFGILSALLIVDAVTALTAGLVFVVLYLIIIRLFRARLRKNSQTISTAQGARVKCIQEGLGGIRDVILDSNQAHYVNTFAHVDQRLRNAQATNAFLSQAPRYVVEMIGIGLIVALALTLSRQPGGLLQALPVLGALALGAARLLPLIQKLYQAWASFSGNFKVMEDVLALLSLPRDAHRIGPTVPFPFERKIELNNIEFTYATDLPAVIQSLTVQIPKGFRVGIVGKTGSGKSTLMDIVMGLLQPTSGQMLVDGQVIDGASLRAWQEHIAHVPQHIYLSDSSIAENIALGEDPKNINMDRVRKAAQQAQIADFIETHRQGYDTRVGERGIQLSGGQRQRIGIARALYKSNADVLVFDEASSALDMATETAVMDAVNQLDPNLTVFIIAHRVQTLQRCDLVLRLEDGRLIAHGRYDEVVQQQEQHGTVDMRHPDAIRTS